MFLFLPFLSSKGEWLRRCSESWEKRRRRKGGQREELSLWPRGGGRILPSNRLMGMCRWIWSHFHEWVDCYGVAFL